MRTGLWKIMEHLRNVIIYHKVVYFVICFMIGGITVVHNGEIYNYSTNYRDIARQISLTTNARTHLKGTIGYNTRRKVSNGLCNGVFPDLIVLPKTTKDVSQIIKISRYYNVPITVRSGGHSFLCTSIKRGKYQYLEAYLVCLCVKWIWNLNK